MNTGVKSLPSFCCNPCFSEKALILLVPNSIGRAFHNTISLFFKKRVQGIPNWDDLLRVQVDDSQTR